MVERYRLAGRIGACVLGGALAVPACAPQPGKNTTPKATAVRSNPAPSLDELRNATYVGIGAGPVRLTAGRWEGEPFVDDAASRPSVTLAGDLRLSGDVDGDGIEEAIVLLDESAGGSGTFVHLALMGRRGDDVVSRATARVGDRVQVRAGRIAGGRIVLDVIQAGPDDPACCPAQKATRTWTLAAERLTEFAPEIVGTVSLADLTGVEWVLRSFRVDDPAPREPQVTLVFDGSRIAGGSGCNRYFGEAKTGERPGDLSFGPIGVTRMACPEPAMTIEQRYFLALAGVQKFGFLAGRLALHWIREGDAGTLLFDAREPENQP